jgi:hypothetical protein
MCRRRLDLQLRLCPDRRSLLEYTLVSPLDSTGVEEDTTTHQDEQDGWNGRRLVCRNRHLSKKSMSPIKLRCPAGILSTSNKKVTFEECCIVPIRNRRLG